MKIQISVTSESSIADCRLPNESSLKRCSVAALQRESVPGASTLQRAFTLVEMLLVITIIGILAALVIPKMVGRSEQARLAAAHADISSIKTALDAYEVDNGFYPKGLQDLIQQPSNARNWHGPYLDNLPVDPWGNPYVYAFPGRHNPSGFDLYSVGPDGKAGTADDIGNWTN
jgi:general secretion pathway protein G